jgi:hypothetical protein
VRRRNRCGPTRGSSSTSSATASATVIRIGFTWWQVDHRHRLGRERPDGGVAEALHARALEQVGRQPGEAFVGTHERANERSASSARRLNTVRDVLERLALEQAGEQQVALLPQRELLVEVDVGAARQQAPGLELDQRGGDQQELGGDVEVEAWSRSSSTR